MRGATLLSKDCELFQRLSEFLRELDYGFAEAENSIRLNGDGGSYWLLSARMDGEHVFDEFEIPEEVSNTGYSFGYLVECRDEELFCDVVKAAGHHFDFLVCDSDGVVYRPSDIEPDQVVL